jgi:NTE family protein
MNFYNPLILVSLLLVLEGCASTGQITNAPVSEQLPTNRQQITTGQQGRRSDDAFFFISLSGGGTRAAALSYGVLQELRDTTYLDNGTQRRLVAASPQPTMVSTVIEYFRTTSRFSCARMYRKH